MIELLIPFEVPSQNTRDRTHFRTRHAQREDIVWLLKVALGPRAHRLPPHLLPRRVQLFTWRTQRIKDHANLVGGAKGLVDALVVVGLLKDDSDRWAFFEYGQDIRRNSPTGQLATRIIITEAREGMAP